MFLSQWLRYIHENYTNWNSKQKVFFVCHWKKITFQRHRANQSQDIERIVETCFEDLLGHPNPTIKSKQSRNNDALNHNGLQFLLLFFMNKFLLFVRFYVQTSLRILDLQLNYEFIRQSNYHYLLSYECVLELLMLNSFLLHPLSFRFELLASQQRTSFFCALQILLFHLDLYYYNLQVSIKVN